MMTSGPDGVITAADLLFGSTENAHEAMTRHVMSAGRTMGRAFERLPRVTREAAVREAAVAAVGLLKMDLMEVLVSGWREHRDIFGAARRTPGHAGQQGTGRPGPAPDHHRPAARGRHPGRRPPGAHPPAWPVHLLRGHRARGGHPRRAAGRGPRRARRHRPRPDHPRARGAHQAVAPRAARGQVPAARFQAPAGQRLPGRVPRPAPRRPGPRRSPVGRRAAERRDSGRSLPGRGPDGRPRPGHQPQRRRAGLRGGAPPGPASAWSDSADLADAGQTRAEPIRTAPPGAEHPSSAESDHSSASWWEKSQTHPGPTRAP